MTGSHDSRVKVRVRERWGGRGGGKRGLGPPGGVQSPRAKGGGRAFVATSWPISLGPPYGRNMSRFVSACHRRSRRDAAAWRVPSVNAASAARRSVRDLRAQARLLGGGGRARTAGLRRRPRRGASRE
jgi:hypothetical protein